MRFNCELSKALSDLAISDALLGVDAAFSQFYNILMTLVENEHAPLKTVSSRQVKEFSKPWITSGINLRRSIKVKINFFTPRILPNTNFKQIKFQLLLGRVRRVIIIISFPRT